MRGCHTGSKAMACRKSPCRASWAPGEIRRPCLSSSQAAFLQQAPQRLLPTVTRGPVPWSWMMALMQGRAGLPTSAPLTHGPAQLTAHPRQPHHRPPRGQEDGLEVGGASGAKHGHGPEAAVGAPHPPAPGQHQARFQLAWILPHLTAQDEASVHPQQRRGGPERYWGPTSRRFILALGLKHGGAPETHWPGPTHPSREACPPLPSPGQGVPGHHLRGQSWAWKTL